MKIIGIFLIVLIVSCSDLGDPLDRMNKSLAISSKSRLRREIPQSFSDSSIYGNWLRDMLRKTGLPSLENGSEAYKIRIWREFEWGKTCFVLARDNNSWFSECYVFKPVSTKSHNVDSILVITKHFGIPKSGWNTFLNTLIDFDLLELHDESEIGNYFVATDLPVIAVEISATNFYKYYQLSGIYVQSRSIKDIRSMIKILGLLKREFPGIDVE